MKKECNSQYVSKLSVVLVVTWDRESNHQIKEKGQQVAARVKMQVQTGINPK